MLTLSNHHRFRCPISITSIAQSSLLPLFRQQNITLICFCQALFSAAGADGGNGGVPGSWAVPCGWPPPSAAGTIAEDKRAARAKTQQILHRLRITGKSDISYKNRLTITVQSVRMSIVTDQPVTDYPKKKKGRKNNGTYHKKRHLPAARNRI